MHSRLMPPSVHVHVPSSPFLVKGTLSVREIVRRRFFGHFLNVSSGALWAEWRGARVAGWRGGRVGVRQEGTVRLPFIEDLPGKCVSHLDRPSSSRWSG